MTTLTIEKTIPTTPERLWSILQDFGGIARWNKNLSGSRILAGKAASGVGAERQCDLSDGRNWIRERVLEWTPGESMTIDIFEGTMPLKSAQVTLGLRRGGPGTTTAFMTMAYQPKMGVFGALLDALMLRRMMRGSMNRVLDGLATEAQRTDTGALAA